MSVGFYPGVAVARTKGGPKDDRILMRRRLLRAEMSERATQQSGRERVPRRVRVRVSRPIARHRRLHRGILGNIDRLLLPFDNRVMSTAASRQLQQPLHTSRHKVLPIASRTAIAMQQRQASTGQHSVHPISLLHNFSWISIYSLDYTSSNFRSRHIYTKRLLDLRHYGFTMR